MTLQAGPFICQTAVNSNEVGTCPWINTENAATNDASVTTLSAYDVGYSNYLKLSNFGFEIPTGAIIEGIAFSLEIAELGRINVYPGFRRIKVIKSNGDLGSVDKITTKYGLNIVSGTTLDFDLEVALLDTTYFGDDADLWGEEWTAEDINNSNFGLAIQTMKLEGRPIIRKVECTVFYHEAE